MPIIHCPRYCRDVALLIGLVSSLGACLDPGESQLVPATVAADPELPRFELGDGRLAHLQTFGDPNNPVVIVLHGGPGGDHRDYLHLDRANIGINTWQGNFNGTNSFDFTTGLAAFQGQTLFITGTSEGRLGHDFQLTYQIPSFPTSQVLHLPNATHSELLRLPESLAHIRQFLEGAP